MNGPLQLALIDALRAAMKTTPSGSLEANAREALTALYEDLGDYLAGPTQAGEHESAIEHLEEVALRFEAKHPAVGTAIREAINTLVKAGV